MSECYKNCHKLSDVNYGELVCDMLMLPIDSYILIDCRGTIEAEFWKKDVENVFNDKDSFVKVLEIKESQWPGAFYYVISIFSML